MRLVDHLYFVAEHDDHHLARIWELVNASRYFQSSHFCGRSKRTDAAFWWMCVVTPVHGDTLNTVRSSFLHLSRAAQHTCCVARGTGGRRAAHKNTVNKGWRNEGFRGYADYMQTQEFAEQIDWLMARPDLSSVVIMCAEALPWRCHRCLIGDAILARNGFVEDIFVLPDGRSSRKLHSMTPFARVEEGRVFYPPATVE